MAIAPDVHGTAVGTTSVTLNLTLAAGASLWVGAWVDGTTITSVSWNGSEALTNIDSNNSWGGTLITSTWYLANPTSGSHSVTIAFGGTAVSCALLGASFTGAATSPLGAHGTRAFAVGATTQALTTTQDNSYIFWFTSNNNSLTLTAGASTTLLDYQRVATDGTDHGSFYGTTTTAGSYTLTEVQTITNSGWQGCIAEIKEAVAAGPTNVKTWNGVTQSTGIKTYNGVALASTKSVNGVT